METPWILVCDSDKSTQDKICEILQKEDYVIRQASNAKECFQHIRTTGWPKLAILDLHLPRKNGLWICQIFQKTHPKKRIPVLITAPHAPHHEEQAFQAGAIDFLHKPFHWPCLLHRIRTHFDLVTHQHTLEETVNSQFQHIQGLQSITIFALTSLCAERDQETGSHILRTQHYTQLLAQSLAKAHPELTEEQIKLIHKYSPLHDIGKIGIPDKILLKPGKLTDEEFETIKTHTLIGFRAIANAEEIAQFPLPELTVAKKIIRSHHERWDGKGYPDGLIGENIPMEARIMAVADVYDAIRSQRAYKPARPHKDAAEIILSERGKQFDPEVVDAFEANLAGFQTISNENQNSPEEIDTLQRKLAHA